jgi:hypothetical protein
MAEDWTGWESESPYTRGMLLYSGISTSVDSALLVCTKMTWSNAIDSGVKFSSLGRLQVARRVSVCCIGWLVWSIRGTRKRYFGKISNWPKYSFCRRKVLSPEDSFPGFTNSAPRDTHSVWKVGNRENRPVTFFSPTPYYNPKFSHVWYDTYLLWWNYSRLYSVLKISRFRHRKKRNRSPLGNLCRS